ncbi:MAG: hypothetical protein II532_00310 [Bacteroidales bacterium]|nr:hypothetical protein [Bacteroidales bacterium]
MMNKTLRLIVLLIVTLCATSTVTAQSHPRAYIYKNDANLLFAGIENHLEIDLQSIRESEVTVSAKPSSVILQRIGVGENGRIQYAVIPNVPGKAKIVVSSTIGGTDYDLGYKEFVVKSLPTPYITVGQSISGDFVDRHQIPERIGVMIPGDFFKDIHFSISSFCITHPSLEEPLCAEGDAFTPAMREFLTHLDAGQIVNFTDVIVKLPNGDTVTLGASFFMK